MATEQPTDCEVSMFFGVDDVDEDRVSARRQNDSENGMLEYDGGMKINGSCRVL